MTPLARIASELGLDPQSPLEEVLQSIRWLLETARWAPGGPAPAPECGAIEQTCGCGRRVIFPVLGNAQDAFREALDRGATWVCYACGEQSPFVEERAQ